MLSKTHIPNKEDLPMLQNIQKAEKMISQFLIPATDKNWHHMAEIYKLQIVAVIDSPILKKLVMQYLMIALALVKDIQESTTWTVIMKFYSFIMKGIDAVCSVIGLDKADPEKLLWKLFPRTMVEFEKMDTLIKDSVSENEKIMEKLMENESFKEHVTALESIMEEYKSVFMDLDEEEAEANLASTIQALKIDELHRKMATEN